MRDSRIEHVKRIAVLKSGAIGDFIVTLPAFQALRDTYPDAEIVLLGSAWHKSFAVRRTCVDHVFALPPIAGITNGIVSHELIDEFVSAMQEQQFDIAISFQGNGLSSNPILKRLNARVTAGTITSHAEELDRSIPYYYYQSEVSRYLEIVRLVGASSKCVEPAVSILPEDYSEISAQLCDLEGEKFVIINPVATDLRRMWPLENYSSLCDSLVENGLKVVFTGSANDQHAVNEIISSMKFKATNACGISLGAFAALASLAALTISPDTGPLHLAQAVQCPTVGMYWVPNLINWGPVNRRLHRPLVSWELHCPLCSIIPNDPYPFQPVDTCKHEVSFIRNIRIEEVLNTALSLINEHQSTKINRNKKFEIQKNYAE